MNQSFHLRPSSDLNHVRGIDLSMKLGPPPGREGRREPLPPGRPISRLRKESSPSPVCGRKAALLPPAEGKQPFSRLREKVARSAAGLGRASRAALAAVPDSEPQLKRPCRSPPAPSSAVRAPSVASMQGARSISHTWPRPEPHTCARQYAKPARS